MPPKGKAAAPVAAKPAAAKPAVAKATAPKVVGKAAAAPAKKNAGASAVAKGEAAAPKAVPKESKKEEENVEQKQVLYSGKCRIRYNHYNEEFTVTDGRLTSAAIDAEYAISFAFQNCFLHLKEGKNEENGAPATDGSYLEETVVKLDKVEEDGPETTTQFNGLEGDKTYWVIVDEDEEEKKKAEIRQQEYVKRMEEEAKNKYKEDAGVERMENCSCIEGNPCASSYCCKDWKNRFEVAKKNGWKGFS